MFAILGSFSRSYPAVSESVTQARRDIDEFIGGYRATADQRDAVRSAVSEAVANAVIHAYRDADGDVQLTASVARGELWVLVADDGCGFQTEARSPGLGWGLALIAHVSDDFVLAERAEGGTEVRMRFSLGVAGEAAG